ncbi:VOC family protein [Kribbella sp. CA-247076]|uniref:VOC family protein n=1 Tax=Kribbella sp. CA-247076 TaxID=3239941 RepID=UPI003D8EE147
MSEDWRVLGSQLSAWYDASSQTAGAALVGRIAELSRDGLPLIELRDRGVRVRVADPERAEGISTAARELGLTADPSALQELHLGIEAVDRTAVSKLWHGVLGYDRNADSLVDPLRRDPTFSFGPLDEPRPLRNRIHVDVVRPSTLAAARETAAAAGGREELASDYHCRIADVEGNEVDVVGGDVAETASDWQLLFGGMTFYPTTSPAQAVELATAVAGLVDESGMPLLVDLRPDGVIIDTGKDLWEEDERFADLAVRVQAAAHGLGLTADPARLRFVQFGLDAVDVPAIRSFWQNLLGYEPDGRPHVTDITDPRRLNPVLFFQQMEATDEDRRRQRNRLRLELYVAPDHAQSRIDATLTAGGRIIDQPTPNRTTLTDPENNHFDLITTTP